MAVVPYRVISSGISEIQALPVSWFVKRLKDQNFYFLQLKMCNIYNISEQVSPHFTSDAFRRDDREDSATRERKTAQTNLDEAIHEPQLILKFDLSLNEIKRVKVEDLIAFSELRSLDLSMNAIKTFQGIGVATKLVFLNLSYNNITDLPNDALSECVSLQTLDLSVNKISSLTGFPNLTSLLKLNLRNNKLKDLRGLQILRSLRQVNVSKNKLVTIIHICPCLEILELILRDNMLSNVSDIISALSPLSRLQQVTLKGNPVLQSYSELELQALFKRDTSVEILDGCNVRPPKMQFKSFNRFQPPNPNDELKSKLKIAVQESMKEGRDAKRKKVQEKVGFLHKKILTLHEELEAFDASSITDAEAWCRYIDTLTDEEAQSLTLSQIRAAALAEPDGYLPTQGPST